MRNFDPVRNLARAHAPEGPLGRAISNGVAILGLKPKYRPLERGLRRFLAEALSLLNKSGHPIDVFLVSDEVMRRLNRQHRGKNKPTNVLSFPFSSAIPYPKDLKRPLGEIYLAPDYIRREGSSLSDLALHGLLHLLGYTHSKRSDKMRMEKAEVRILKNVKHRYRLGYRLGSN